MFVGLPLRHRTALAVGLYLVAVVIGTWASTFVGEPTPTIWGVAIGGLAGLGLAIRLLIGSVRVTPARAGAPARR
jgi:hypothetical protein